MSTKNKLTAVIADDEPLLVESLQSELANSWPELQIVATVNNGDDAIEAVLSHTPHVIFLDIKMPGISGIGVAQSITEDWPDETGSRELPLIVFVTAFDQYAVDAFENSAVDYLIKPVNPKRLMVTIERLRQRLETQNQSASDELAQQLHHLITHENKRLQSTEKSPTLQVIRAGVGDQIRIIPVDEVILFESADKYVTVHTAQGESVIRESLKKLLPQLDSAKFEQVHRKSIVNMAMVESAHRDETGKMTLQCKDIDKEIVVSRVYRHLFQPM